MNRLFKDSFSITMGLSALVVSLLFGCNDEQCEGECNHFWPRFALGIVSDGQGDAGTVLEGEVTLESEITGETTYQLDNLPEYICDYDAKGMIWTICTPNPPGDKWVDVTIKQDEERTATLHVLLAKHNYCGHNIAYVLCRLHEDGPPTCEEVKYVSPCEGNGVL